MQIDSRVHARPDKGSLHAPPPHHMQGTPLPTSSGFAGCDLSPRFAALRRRGAASATKLPMLLKGVPFLYLPH